MKRNYLLFLKDIYESIQWIERFIKDKEFIDFDKDEMMKSAAVKKLEIIGEASKNIPKEFREKHKEFPWRKMINMRDKITHFNFGINYEIVWKVIKEELPPIKSKIENILKDLESEGTNDQ